MELPNRNLRFWVGLAVLALPFVFWGNRLALSRPSPNVLRFAHTFTTESEGQILAEAIKEFETTHSGIRVVQSAENSDTYQTIGWRVQFQSRRQPDIYFNWQGFKVQEAVARGWAMDVSPYISNGFADQFLPGTLKGSLGAIYFLPHSIDISVLVWYNQELFQRSNLKEPATLEEWIHLCGTIRQRGALPLIQGNRDLWPLGNVGAELLGQAGGVRSYEALFIPSQSVSANDVHGLRWIDALNEVGAFDLPGVFEKGALASFGDIDAKVYFLTGKAAQHVIGSWFLADIQDATAKGELKFPIGVFAVPSGKGESNSITAVTTGFLVNPKTQNPKAAVEFVELLLSRKYQEKFSLLGNLSARRDARQFTKAPLGKRMLEILASADELIPPPDTGFSADQANAFYELCAKLFAGKISSTQAPDVWNADKRQLARKGL